MNTLLKQPVKTHEGEGWSKGTITEFYKEENDKEVAFIINDGDDKRTTVKYRNVGDKNKEASIQFNIEKYNYKTNRTTDISFSIPYEMADLFINNLKA